ncbi:SIR2 family protein [Castellaniella hirudinis]|uniref:SIR2 family protein n=1 Tax=Castellaniella hirudinis TaxID=1144617 RepID=A0ABV8S1M1_9BURK
MRFLADGPSIPDDLLLARDQGRVIFFCGAGVSRARAKLPDFFGLARSVVSKLGVGKDSPANKLIQESQELDRRIGVPGVISADRVFGFLERDFSSRDIEEAVASALKPPAKCDLTAHRILLDLATTPEGTVQLVTTNFDRLFDDCQPQLRAWQPPMLPDPVRSNEINGVVYLHGRSNSDYTGSDGDGFILSSSAFGRAYLADGWGTTFIREILEKYIVVFVGYTADDPPVQYLLEALQKSSRGIGNIYAFQSGDHDDADARWRHKGVRAISYSPENDHAVLWESLAAWAVRARDPDAWYAKVIEASKKGPADLQPHERGQVAHIISTYEGVKKFSSGETMPPAEWLCVFDKNRRFAKPGNTGRFGRKGFYVDPFDLYGLDFDTPPAKNDPEDHYAKREVPSDAWDAFEINRLDKSPVQDDNLAAFRGYWASRSPLLLPRIAQLGVWLAKVCDQPAAVWWAAHQSSLHQIIKDRISWELEHSNQPISYEIRKAWRSLFESWSYVGDFHRDWHTLQAIVKKDGWSSTVARFFGEIIRPRFYAKPDFWSGQKPPDLVAEDVHDSCLMRLDVKYPEINRKITVPAEWCLAVVKEFRRSLEVAVALEHEIGGYGLRNISPINQDDVEDSSYGQSHGLSGVVMRFTELFSQLTKINKIAARREFLAWPQDDDTVFARLRIWASGNRSIVSDDDFSEFIVSLSKVSFWDGHHQRDLLLVISQRWNNLKMEYRVSIEEKILAGPDRWLREKVAEFKKRRAWVALGRMYWLQNSGCRISASARKKIKLLRAIVPDWKEEYGLKAAESLESRGGWVRKDTTHDELANTSLSCLLQRAQDLSGRSEDFLVEKDPFAGLAAQRPIRAFSALTYSAKRGDFPEWAWQRFLSSEARKNDKRKLIVLIAERLASYSNKKVSIVIRPAADWLRDVSKALSTECPSVFDRIFTKLIDVLRESPSEGGSGIVRGSDGPDWTMEAINSPTGRMAEALFNDPRMGDLNRNQGFPPEWIVLAELLLALPGDLSRYALVIFFHNLNWFFSIDKEWTERFLLSVFEEGDEDTRNAAWSGFLWGSKVPNRELYMRLKNDMVEFALKPLPVRRSHGEVIASILLAGWGTVDEATGERCISDEEMHELLLSAGDDFRSRILWLAQRWSGEDTEGSQGRWRGKVSELLGIWPRQLSARTPNTSARLCELAFSSGDKFPTIVALVLPLLSKIEKEHLMLPELHRSGSSAVEKHPEQALALLYAILPDNSLSWPYEIEGMLEQISTANSSLDRDDRLIALKRRWDSR